MRLNKKNKKKIIIAVVLGVVATISFLNSMNSKKADMAALNKRLEEQKAAVANLKKNPFENKEEKEKKVFAVIAAQDINVGDTFILEMVKAKEYNETDVPEDFFKTTAMVAGKKSGKNLTAGQFITLSDIQSADVNTIEIPNDTRAISIPVAQFKGIASHIRVGSRVDILKVANPPEFIAQNVRIVAFETPISAASSSRYNSKPGNRINSQYITAIQASAITFLIPLDIISKLLDATFKGQLQLIARNNNDEKIIVTEKELPPPPPSDMDIEITTTIPEYPEEEEEELPAPEISPPDPKKIELISASSISTIEFEPEEIQSSEEESSSSEDLDKLKDLLEMVQ